MTKRTIYLFFTLIFTAFFALFVLSYYSRTVEAENSIRVDIITKNPTCEATLWADDVPIGTVSMKGKCRIDVIKD